jgi:Leucine-rich repeat (LRR) protein
MNNNKLTSFPDKIGNMHLVSVDFTDNKIKEIPATIKNNKYFR